MKPIIHIKGLNYELDMLSATKNGCLKTCSPIKIGDFFYRS